MQIKLIFTRKVVHLASFGSEGFVELGSGLFPLSFLGIACIFSETTQQTHGVFIYF